MSFGVFLFVLGLLLSFLCVCFGVSMHVLDISVCVSRMLLHVLGLLL